MNCPRCNTPLAPNTRFCPNCGTPITSDEFNPAQTYPTYQPIHEAPTEPTNVLQQRPQPAQGIYYQPTSSVQPGTTRSAGDPNVPGPQNIPPRRRRRIGCLARTIITLLVLLILFGGGWFFILRPYLHALVQNQIDQVLTTAVDQIPPTLPPIPIGSTIPITETLINNLFVLNSSPSDPIQNEQAQITPDGLRVYFKAYNFPCAVMAMPHVKDGQLSVDNVTVQGIALLVMSPDEMTTLLNKHLADAQQRLNRPITAVNLKDHELDLILG